MKKKISIIFLNYLRVIAKIQITKIRLLLQLQGKKLQIVGITGSAGKTSTLLTLETILKPEFKVKTNSGSNSESGIPLNILDLKADNFRIQDWFKLAILAPIKLLINWKLYEIYLVEMGIDEPEPPKNMSYLLKIIKPNIAIFLNVNPVHSAQFDHTVSKNIESSKRLPLILQKIGQEKAKLVNSLPQNGVAIINLDDPIVVQTTQTTRAQKLTFSQNSSAAIKILKTEIGIDGFHLNFSYDRQHYSVDLKKYALPQIFSTSIASSILAAISLDVNIKKAISNLENLSLPSSRSSLLAGVKDTKIIDSSYNSSPSACVEMLQLLSKSPNTKIAVLGDMRELGEQSAKAHQEVYKQAQKSADLIISVGPETQKYFSKNSKTHSFLYWWQAAEFLKSQIKGQETILVKGSQNTIYLEELVKSILKSPSDSSLLCRQSPYWLKTKNNFYKQHSST